MLLFVPVSLLFSYSQMNIYNNKAQIFKKERLVSNIIQNIPQTMIESSFIIYKPKIASYTYKKGNKTSLYDVWASYKNKTVFYKNKEVTLRYIQQPYALVELPNKKLETVELKEILFPPYEGTFLATPNHIVLPKRYAQREIRYGYMLERIHWKSFYIMKFEKYNQAQLKGKFEITNDTDTDFHLDAVRLIAGTQNNSISSYAPNYYRTTRYKARSISLKSIRSAPMQNYYSYTYKREITLPSHAKSYISFMDRRILITKKYTVHLSDPRYLDEENKKVPQVSVQFKVPEALPYGTVLFINQKRVYLGDAKIANTPKDVYILLDIGKDFFSIVKERLVDIRNFKDGVRSTVEYTLTNRSKKERTYRLFVPLPEAKRASITTTKKYRFKDANTLLFEISLAPNRHEQFDVTYEQRK